MKRLFSILVAAILTLAALHNKVLAQCTGLRNPTAFTASYSGQLGEKPNMAFNPHTGVTGMTFAETEYTGAQLAGLMSDKSTSYCGSTIDNSTRFRIMSNTDGPGSGTNLGKDPLVNYELPYAPPDPIFTKSIRVGNCRTGKEAEALYYTMEVNPDNALVFVWYSMVIQAPGHGVNQDPLFVVRVSERKNGEWKQISDTLCYMIGSTPASNGGSVTIGQDGWHSLSGTGGTIYYREWNKVAINLSKYLSHRVRIEVMIGDCSASGHYGYCYMAGTCQAMRLSSTGCAAGASESVDTIRAPKGLNAYRWFRSRTGVTTSTNLSDFIEISGANDSILTVRLEDFEVNNGGQTSVLNQNTFLCEMTSYMDPSRPITSVLITDVGNKKPTLMVDTAMNCESRVELTDKSVAYFISNQATDNVNHNATQWTFYNSATPTTTPVHTAMGDTAGYTFAQGGNYCVKVRITAYDTTCWNEKIVRIRAFERPHPHYTISRNDICPGEETMIVDNTSGVTWRKWVVHHSNGTSDTLAVAGPGLNMTYDSTEVIELIVRSNARYSADTNNDGIEEMIYCDASYFDTVRVGKIPELTVSGDTIVCMGTESIVNISSDVPNCTFEWFRSYNGTTPMMTGTTLTDRPTADIRYYVKATSQPNHCIMWDSITITLVDPTLEASTTDICTGQKVVLQASKAFNYTWSSIPDDYSLNTSSRADTVEVSPVRTTTYSMVGHGTNGCSANALTVTINVFPYPIPQFEMTPTFVDSEEPVVEFRDVSPYSVSSLWTFGPGLTSTQRQVSHTFTDLTQDSLQINLTSANQLGCESDTMFYIPVSLFAVWFPNVFTPTMVTNRTFKVFTHNDLEYYSLFIYDRRGNVIYATHDQNGEWDGKYDGKYCDQGSYVYVCRYRRTGTTDLVTRKGTVLLLH